MVFKRFALFFVTCSALFGSALSFDTLSAYPRSLAKDYYIYRYLTEHTPTPQEAWELLGQAQRMSNTLLYAFGDTVQEPGFKEAIACLRLDKKAFLTASTDCRAIRMSPSFFLTLSKTEQDHVIKTVQTAYPETFAWMTSLRAEDPHAAMLENGATQFLYLFTSTGEGFRNQTLNRPLSKETLHSFSTEPLFQSFVTQVLFERTHTELATSLLTLSPQESRPSAQSAFFLGLIALQHDLLPLADAWFAVSFEGASLRFDKDKALFWRYLVTQENHYLEALVESFDINMYTLAAYEKLGKPLPDFPRLSPQEEALLGYSATDPFTWRFTLDHLRGSEPQELEAFAKRFNTQATLPQYAFMQERLNRYQVPYFIMPYGEFLEGVEAKRKALIFAIARQESRFIPAAISTSYALGMMQFMPFLARDIAKKQGMQNFDIDHMFQPQIAYRFANIHLDYLEAWLYHPVLVAYAYNGGIGFVRRTLQRGDLFTKGPYEPFLSMELVPYAESREYGKKVLANYVIYRRLLGEDVSIWDLFERLSEPDATDRFRSPK
ncbi:MAG: lytic transglycosylase domain-containing protein [Campylobacterales bacterium]|nr:lytic transglycosylase domain-containing protein [Campylobacterales bacterium]